MNAAIKHILATLGGKVAVALIDRITTGKQLTGITLEELLSEATISETVRAVAEAEAREALQPNDPPE